MIIRIVRSHDDPDQFDVDLEVCLEDYPEFDPEDEDRLRQLEATILLYLEQIQGE